MTIKPPKYYLQAENDRNTRHGLLFIALIKRAFGVDEVTFPGHHFVFDHAADMQALNIATMNEIPSADTLLFDHPIMTAVFGDRALGIMARISQEPAETRDALVQRELDLLDAAEAEHRADVMALGLPAL